MSATCDECAVTVGMRPGEGPRIHFCPLHAEAEAMRGLLRDLVERYEAESYSATEVVCGACSQRGKIDRDESQATRRTKYAPIPHAEGCRFGKIRAILARIDGDTPDA